ncbi:MAG: hypothetical protein V5A68_07685, partial [Candidatus Thermoplasmatota archaeon]
MILLTTNLALINIGESQQEVTLSISNIKCKVDESDWSWLNLTNADKIGLISFNISWNPDIIELISIKNNTDTDFEFNQLSYHHQPEQGLVGFDIF